jgi:RNA polymerase sigma-70 factor (ECF subfamily)
VQTVQGVDRRRAFEALAAEIVEPVRRYLWRRTDPATADDVLAETLAVLWRRFDDIPADGLPWAIGVARLQLRNAERARRRQDRLVERIAAVDPPSSSAPERDDTADIAVRRVLARLRESDAELLRLWVWEELEPRQIAEVLGITANAAAVRLHRARKRFADLFGKDQAAGGQSTVKEGRAR